MNDKASHDPHGYAHHNRWKGWLRQSVKFFISVGLFAILIRTVDWSGVRGVLVKADPQLLAVAMLALAVAVLLAAWRWSLCASASAIALPRGFYVRATYAATFMGQMLPAGVGVDAVRVAYLMHGRTRLTRALQALLLDRLIGVAAVIVVMGAGLPLMWNRLPLALRLLSIALMAGLLGAGGGLWLFARLPFIANFRGSGRRRKLIDLILAVRGSILSRDVLYAFLVSVVFYCVNIAGVRWFAAALGLDVPYVLLLAIVAMAIFLSLMPISLNGWGVREGAMVVGLSALSVSRESALAISLLYGAGSAIATLPGAFIWAMRRRHVVEDAETRPETESTWRGW
jgi:uncharacterized membrane protein YbhN (UPF0104 family)